MAMGNSERDRAGRRQRWFGHNYNVVSVQNLEAGRQTTGEQKRQGKKAGGTHQKRSSELMKGFLQQQRVNNKK